MKIGLIGKKIGMSRLFQEDGVSIPVTLIKVEPNYITQIKSSDSDTYNAVQLGSIEKNKASRVSRALRGHFAKSRVPMLGIMHEFKFPGDADMSVFQSGQVMDLNAFIEGDLVDVTAVSKGKGFSGVIKRWNFSTQDATHGNSLSHRSAGSIGQRQTPGRVFKGKKMAGRMGNKRITVQSLAIVKFNHETGILLIKGAVPGAKNSSIIVKPAVKKCNS